MSVHRKESPFHHNLISNLHLDDNTWRFDVPNLPSSPSLRQASLIKAIRLYTDARKHSMVLELERSNSNRSIEGVPLDRLILLSLEGFRPLVRGVVATEQGPATDLRPRTAKDVSDYSIRLFNSQLKSRSCFLMAAPKEEISRMVDASREELGKISKENKGQAGFCVQIYEPIAAPHSIVVLTPYTRQAELLKRMLSSLSHTIEVSNIDGFQGREADIVVFVTVRCNEHRNIGFLKDTRRMNVALTRARTALVVVGYRATLTEGTEDKESSAMWKRLLDELEEVKLES